MPPVPSATRGVLAGAAALALFAACEDPFALPRASFPNVVDTVRLYALEGTALHQPSAYHLERAAPVRTDQTFAFDFAFNVDSTGAPVFLPTGALGLGRGSGLQLVAQPFDSITLAPQRGYDDTTVAVVAAGDVILVRSRPISCFFQGTFPLYAKTHVLAVDLVERTIDFEILVNGNCGYRGLEPGLPER